MHTVIHVLADHCDSIVNLVLVAAGYLSIISTIGNKQQ